MDRKDLERNLDLGTHFGFDKETDSTDYRGWILINKRKPNERYLALLEPGEEPEFVAEQEVILRKPYRVRVIELNRRVHESDDYETSNDYRLNESYDFSTLDDVNAFILTKFGLDLENVRWMSELDAP
jgi:hypothetical protein